MDLFRTLRHSFAPLLWCGIVMDNSFRCGPASNVWIRILYVFLLKTTALLVPDLSSPGRSKVTSLGQSPFSDDARIAQSADSRDASQGPSQL